MEHRLLAFVRRAAGTRSDAELLAARADRVAFAELVGRHGPMVWSVCRNLLGEADAEDAFQATFLALLRSTIRDGTALASWLHGAAVRVSLAARREAGRRRVRERAVAAPEAAPAPEPDAWADTMAIVHQEVDRLPEVDRAPFILCVLEGLTQAEAAVRLGRTPGTVAGQVTRAKKRLVERLTRRGVVPGLVVLGTTSAAGAVPPALVNRVIEQPEAISPAVLQLVTGVRSVSHTKLVVCAVVVGIVAAVSVWGASGGQPAPVPPAPEKAPAVAAPGDWPMGGRAGDRNPVSLEKNAPTEWQIPDGDKKAKNVKWGAKLGIRSLGGPVVSGGLVWVGTTNQARVKENPPDCAVLSCFRASDGKLLYQYLSPRGDDRTRDWPEQGLSGSPLAEGDNLWFCTNRREVVCLDVGPLRRGTGQPREVWKLDMVKELKIRPESLVFPHHEFLGSAAAYKGLLYVPTGNAVGEDGKVLAPDAPSLVCVRKDTGKVVWSDNSAGKGIQFGHCASPLVIEVGGHAQVIHPQADGWVRAFDAETGKQIWKLDCNPVGAKGDRGLGRAGKRVYVLGTPVYAGGRVYFGTGMHTEEDNSEPGRLFCIDPTKSDDVSAELDDGKGKGKPNPNSAVVWEYGFNALRGAFHQMVSSVAVHGGLVYAADFDGCVHCLDAKSGERRWWHDAKSHIAVNPLVADGKVYVGSEEGEVLVFAAGKTKQLLAKNEFHQPVAGPPVFANGVLYVLTDDHLYAIAAPAK